MKFKRNNGLLLAVVSVFLLTAMLLTVVACSNIDSKKSATKTAAENNSDPITSTNDPSDTEMSRENIPDKLPEDLDYEGATVNMYCRDNWAGEFYAENYDNEIVNDALYERKEAVETRLKVVLKVTAIGDNYKSAETIKNIALSGSNECDISSIRMYEAYGLILDKVFKNLHETQYIDFKAPWWSQGLIKASTVGNDKLYLLIGSIATSSISRMQGVFFNKGVYEKYISTNPDELYQTVIDRKWTLDKLVSLSKQVHDDVNGDGQKDKGDIYGYGASPCANQAASINGVEIQFSKFNQDGYPEFVLNNEHTVEAISKLYDVMWNNEGAYITAASQTGLDELTDKFRNGTLMFLNESVEDLATYRELDDDYAILPMPMLDEDQGEYCTQVSEGASAFGVPASAADPDMSSAVMEALAAEGYRKLIPKYYEEVLKCAYARDNYLAQMLDIMSSTVYFDFVFLYGAQFDNIGNFIPVNLLKKENAGFASEYDKVDDMYKNKLDEIVAIYSKNNP
ncbi:hypothetical protein SDC9_81940 [bioreactor metagenome]|uniref:Uncharacterized protein n=1 Tax=bioreactor metagenome TaxID=1076179 RepID=A0A644Z455_9ZZZZ|nr:hypothetical protein [Oscillospiraceae bacterium]